MLRVIKDNIWHLHSLSTDRFFKELYRRVNSGVRTIYIHFKTQPGPVEKNATPRPLAGK